MYSSDGSLLAYPTPGLPPSIAVRDAHTLRLVRKLALDPLQLASYMPDLAHARILIAPDGRTVYCAYQDFSRKLMLPARNVSRSLVAAERTAAVDHPDRRCSGARGGPDGRRCARCCRRCTDASPFSTRARSDA